MKLAYLAAAVIVAIAAISISVAALAPTGGYTLSAEIEVSAAYPPQISRVTGGWTKSTILGVVRFPSYDITPTPIVVEGIAKAVCANAASVEKAWTATIDANAMKKVYVGLTTNVLPGSDCVISAKLTSSTSSPFSTETEFAGTTSPAE